MRIIFTNAFLRPAAEPSGEGALPYRKEEGK